MELLSPVGWDDVATKQDLDALGHRVEAQLAGLASDLRREMSVGQRQLLFAMLGAMFTLTGLVWAVVSLVP